MRNTNLKIFAVSGKAQHGKDTFANILYQELTNRGHKVLVTHYADLLKYICKTFFNWNGEKDERGRQILQYVGTDVVRKERPNYLVEFVVDVLNLFGDNWEYVIIPDTRFPNEIDVLREHYQKVDHIRVIRTDFESTLTEEQKNHPSETSLDNVLPDITIINNKTEEDLRQLVKQYIENGVIH